MSEIELPPEESESQSPPAAERPFEDLTLAQALGELLHAPRLTLNALREVASAPRGQPPSGIAIPARGIRASVSSRARPVRPALEAGQRTLTIFGLRITAFLIAWWGCGILANTPERTETDALNTGAPLLLIGFLVWLGSEVYADWPKIRQRLRTSRRVETDQETPEPASADAGSFFEAATSGEVVQNRAIWTGLHPMRVLAGLVGALCSFLAPRFTTDNMFTFIGFTSWVASIVLWVVALTPAGSHPIQSVREALARARAIHWRSGTVLALAAIMLVGAAFRLSDLNRVPPEMTSDHVEKILDSYHVTNGQLNVFFANNGGREAAQMYLMALFAQLPGMGFNYPTLKLLSALEGLTAILLMYWMGREIVGEENRRLGNLAGLALAALVAVSYWHTMLSRLGLRIVLTTVVTPVLILYLARALRHNRRGDFIKAGLALGFGLYTYQAVRMLPVVVTAGVVLAFLFHARTWRARGGYLLNYVTLVLVAFVIFVPMFGYWLEYPDNFWQRTQGRLLGDDLITTTDEQGNPIERYATLPERWQAFTENLPVLTNNIRNTLLMFNWKGDVAWISGAPNQPAMDVVTGALLIVGLAAWLARMLRRRDVFDWLLPMALLIMLLPSALSIAYPVENPSHTRTSGALPEAYLIAALPLALLAQSLIEMAPGRRGAFAATGLAAILLVGAYNQNTRTYFVGHYESYLDSSLPYTEAGGVLKGFADSTGSFGNAFMVGYKYWWDYRALGIEAGEPDWPNGIVSMDDFTTILANAYQRTDFYHLDPDRDMLFFLAAEDEGTQVILERDFPQGRTFLRQSYQQDDWYRLYVVPAMGVDGFLNWLAAH